MGSGLGVARARGLGVGRDRCQHLGTKRIQPQKFFGKLFLQSSGRRRVTSIRIPTHGKIQLFRAAIGSL